MRNPADLPPLNGYSFSDIQSISVLQSLDAAFLEEVKQHSLALHDTLIQHRNGALPPLEASQCIIDVAPLLESYLAHLFGIQADLDQAITHALSHDPIAVFKHTFVTKQVKKRLVRDEDLPPFITLTESLKQHLSTDDMELGIAQLGLQSLTDNQADIVDLITTWCVQAIKTPEGQAFTQHWTLFRLPEKQQFDALVPTQQISIDVQDITLKKGDELTYRHRDGFDLTDQRMSSRNIASEINYCHYCHDHEGDLCSKGFPKNKKNPAEGFRTNPLGNQLTGCPLDEKISEMIYLKKQGHLIGALAALMIDNPLCPATGHRICNDCMKSCIYQKQTPVNVPEIETATLTDVFDLPWGVEIFDLLTRWNPIRPKQYLPKPKSNQKVLVAGMGPAGFTLAYYLLMEGCTVVGFDGLKIEALPKSLINTPIKSFNAIKKPLSERLVMGFGGVAEYGITVRWDKNFLLLIYLALARRDNFAVFGNHRFGGSVTVEKAWELGFDHLAIAVGAGLPKALPVKHSLAPGMRQANDFLMALNLTGIAKQDSFSNMQIRMPIIVIGGGLTAIDTATEAGAYYIAQAEKTAHRHTILKEQYGESSITDQLDPLSQSILQEYLAHAKAIAEERQLADSENRPPNFIRLLQQWGGVTIAYRRHLQDSPAYINNHEEVIKAFEEGIYYVECFSPKIANLDTSGHIQSLTGCLRHQQDDDTWLDTQKDITLTARTILVATGTQPNIAYEFEHRGTFERHQLNYQRYEYVDNKLHIAPGVTHCKVEQFGPFTSYQQDNKFVSLLGDTHAVFHGNVVKAMASAKKTYTKIMAVLPDHTQPSDDTKRFLASMTEQFTSTVLHIKQPAPQITEITLLAPLAASQTQPGQFFKLQPFESIAGVLIEGVALMAMEVDSSQGTINFMVIDRGGSSRLCQHLQPNQPVALMGPTGVRSKVTHDNETVLIVGGLMAIARLRSYGPLLREAGNRVIFLGHFDDAQEVYCPELIEQAADVVIWSTPTDKTIPTHRAQDSSITSTDPLQTLLNYAKTNPSIPLADIDRIYLIGDPELLATFQLGMEGELKDYLIKDPRLFGSVYSCMQCMLKGVCAQCLQWQIDPETKERTKAVFACSWQDQPLPIIDVHNLKERLSQNRLQEILTRLWIQHLEQQSNADI